MSLAILSMGTALPATRISAAEAERVAQAVCCSTDEQRHMIGTLYRQSGVQSRHVSFGREVLTDILEQTTLSQSPFLPNGANQNGPATQARMEHYVREAHPLAVRSSQQALDESGVAPRSITHLVTVSCTGFSAPGVDVALIKALGLAATVQRTHVGFMGCHGAVNGLRVAQAYAGADPQARVLLCAVELCALHYHYGWNPKKLVANALFADGAAALVGESGDGLAGDHWQATASGSCLFPDSEWAMTWDIGDRGFDMTLSTRVPSLIGAHLRPWLDDWLADQGLAVERVASWAIHPGGPRILSAVEEILGISRERAEVSHEVLAECGNMSSPTLLFIVDRLRRRGAPRPCVAIGFGPGLVAEATLFV